MPMYLPGLLWWHLAIPLIDARCNILNVKTPKGAHRLKG
jgi:hypothetical protein